MCYKVFFLSLALMFAQATAQAAKSPQECPNNEMWKDCSSECEPSCKNPTPICTTMCGEPKCQCQADLVRDDSLQCVPQSKCPEKESNPQKRQVNEQDPCTTVRCSNGPCVVQNGSAVCTDYASVNTSHETDEPNAKPCACPAGQHCVPRQVQCFRAPCPPIPECVDDN
ncbi:trypsin inhibitor like cysteine rich domain-containing protein [Ditylenchus destructor]|uniref:Trypsin inhibitor like cysteine rich domain-containing protein n=1 Tax=Ditylenchus destructor TaxID=166010 RepID=A0AAD4R9B3_9BILA|nr:trypsin inhibitor like cysteine rich domain-containing protein [Ditylenchus destructor]